MLPKSKRFIKDDFQGKRPKIFFRGDFFDVGTLVLPTQKFACVISKKTIQRAVDRNLIKRRLLNALTKTKTPQQYSLIFYPKKGSVTTPYPRLCEEIKKAFDTLH